MKRGGITRRSNLNTLGPTAAQEGAFTIGFDQALMILSIVFGVLWLFQLIEMIGWLRVKPWAFQLGFKVMAEPTMVPLPRAAMMIDLETENGKFDVAGSHLGLFRRKEYWYGFRFHTPFPIKGVLRWDGPTPVVEGRIPVMPVVIAGVIAVSWITYAVPVILRDGSAGDIALAIAVLIFIVGVCGIDILVEIQRARKILGELQDLQWA